MLLEQQEVAVLVELLDVGVGHRRERRAVGYCDRRVELGGRLNEHLVDLLKAPLDRLQKQLALGAEQAEHVRLGDPDPARDPVDGRPVQARLRELVDRCLDQRVPALGGRDALTRLL